jgi:6-phosphogluconolactonase (cycloisomerase 2 family)
MAVNNGYVYVANLGDSTVGWYTINATTGQLSALSSSTQVVSGGGAGAGAAAVNFNTISGVGTFAYVSNFTANTISIFNVNSTTGALTALSGSGATVALPANSTGPVEVAFDKTGKYAYVVDFTSGDIAQYTVNADGTLTAFATSPVIALGGNPRWITLDTTSNTAYVPNAGTNAIQVLSVGTAGVLTLTASEPLAANSAGVAANPSYVALDQTSTLLYAAERGGTGTGLTAPYNNLMAQFSVSDTGALAPLATPTVATGTTTASEPAEIAFSLAY